MEADFQLDRIQSRIDLVIGITFMALGLSLSTKQIENVLVSEADPNLHWQPADFDQAQTMPEAMPERSQRAQQTRNSILSASIEILKRDGVGALTHARIASETGLAVSATSYHFPQISSLLVAAQAEFFELSKDRYREALEEISADHVSLDELIDFTSFILQREVMLFTNESLALYQFWIEAGRQDRIQGMLWGTIADQARAWTRRLDTIGASPAPHHGMLLQALFVGKLIRLLSSGGRIADLATVRREFSAELTSVVSGEFPSNVSD